MCFCGGEDKLTITTESRAAMVTISAHETTPGHAFSTLVFILSTTSNPLSELLLGPAVFSPVKDEVSSRRTDPSHPCYQLSTISMIKHSNIYVNGEVD